MHSTGKQLTKEDILVKITQVMWMVIVAGTKEVQDWWAKIVLLRTIFLKIHFIDRSIMLWCGMENACLFHFIHWEFYKNEIYRI